MTRHTAATNGVYSYLAQRKGWPKARRFLGVQYRDPVT